MSPIAKKAAGIVAVAILLLILGATVVLRVIAAALLPDDVAAIEDKLPRWVEWLISMPWWAIVILGLALLAYSVWALWPDYTLHKKYTQLNDKYKKMEGEFASIQTFASDRKKMNEDSMERVEKRLEEAIALIESQIDQKGAAMVAAAKSEYNLTIQQLGRSELQRTSQHNITQDRIQRAEETAEAAKARLQHLPQEIRVIVNENMKPLHSTIAAFQREIANKK